MLKHIPVDILFENFDVLEASLTQQYKDNMPDLYARHRAALAKGGNDLESARGNLAFQMMTKHQMAPEKAKQMIKARKKRIPRQPKMKPVVIKMRDQQDDTATVPMRRSAS